MPESIKGRAAPSKRTRHRNSGSIYGGILAKPLPRSIGSKLDPEVPQSQFSDTSDAWRNYVLKLRTREVEATALVIRALGKYYRIDSEEMIDTPENKAEFYEKLALALMLSHVPAFKNIRPSADATKSIS